MFAVAALYASVGHGGASGYLAVLGFTSLSPNQISTAALMLNVLVAGTSFAGYATAGMHRWRLTWPFLLGSVPFAFVGGALRITDRAYYVLLAVVLVAAGYRLIVSDRRRADRRGESCDPHIALAVPLGGGIGLLSGVVGIGGGIFLSPLIVLLGWGHAKRAAATSALFIVVNSLAGLAGRKTTGLLPTEGLWLLLLFAISGGLLGTFLGSRKSSVQALRGLLGVVLVAAAARLIVERL